MQTRRNFLSLAAAQSLLGADNSLPHFAPKAKRVIYLFMYGGPSQIELFDHKPRLTELLRRFALPQCYVWGSAAGSASIISPV